MEEIKRVAEEIEKARPVFDIEHRLSDRARVLLAMAPMNKRKLDIEFPEEKLNPEYENAVPIKLLDKDSYKEIRCGPAPKLDK